LSVYPPSLLGNGSVNTFPVLSVSYERRVCGSVFPPIGARQRSCEIEELLEASFSMRLVSHQNRIDDSFFP
jgi:hypothetical protein